jgi:hypothetical protein
MSRATSRPPPPLSLPPREALSLDVPLAAPDPSALLDRLPTERDALDDLAAPDTLPTEVVALQARLRAMREQLQMHPVQHFGEQEQWYQDVGLLLQLLVQGATTGLSPALWTTLRETAETFRRHLQENPRLDGNVFLVPDAPAPNPPG